MMNKQQVIAKWSGEKGKRLVYPGSVVWPDDDCVSLIRKMCGSGSICEVGCGTGRVASAFQPQQYVGVDINETAIQKAKEDLPSHSFRVIDWDDDLPEADVYLFYTVLLHCPDEELSAVIGRCLRGKRVVVFESMSHKLRQIGNEFQRDLEQYEVAFLIHGWRLCYHKRLLSNYFPHFRDYAIFGKGEE